MPQDTASLWRGAVPLSQAPVRFGPQDAVTEYRRLSKDGHALIQYIEALAEIAWSDEKTSATSNAAARDLERQHELLASLRNRLLGSLRSGKRIGLGFPSPRQPDASPQQVPLDLWDGFIKWDKNTVSADGLQFVGVRVTDAQAVLTRGPGRQSLKTEIEAAFDALDAEGRIDFRASLASHYELVRETVLAKNPERRSDGARGMNNKTLHRHLSERFNRRKHGI